MRHNYLEVNYNSAQRSNTHLTYELEHWKIMTDIETSEPHFTFFLAHVVYALRVEMRPRTADGIFARAVIMSF